MDNELRIIQPNIITHAKYDYTAMQKNILYNMIEQLQQKMYRNKLDRNLFGNIYIEIPIAEIAGNKNHNKVYEAAEELIGKKFHYNWKNEFGKENKTTTGLVAAVNHQKNERFIKLTIPEEIVPVLLYIGEGFTKYQKTIAITLKSVHAKRMYELCNRWRDLGGFVVSMDEYKKMMCLEDKYEKLSMLKARVLDVAKKELDEDAELSYEYSLEKKDSRNFNVIKFKIYEKVKEKEQEEILDEQKILITNMLAMPYPLEINNHAVNLTHTIMKHDEYYKIFIRFQGLRKELKEKTKTKKDIIKLLPFILKTDFGIDCE